MQRNKIAHFEPIRRQREQSGSNKVRRELENIESVHIKEILKIIKRKNKSQMFLFQGLKITRRGDKLFMLKQ